MNFIYYIHTINNFIYNKHDYYLSFEDFYNDLNIIKNKLEYIDEIIINDECVLLITCWTIGIGRGYAELYSILIKYFIFFPNKIFN
jgi:hypothetical protein